MSIRELACAKINLTLCVQGRRPDGYHELESLVAFADTHDVVQLEPGADATIGVSGPFAGRIDGENLLARALALLRSAEPALRLGRVKLEKNLPVAAGVGGGSADAAALLRAVRRANPGLESRVPWRDIASRLGADVPVCFAGRPVLMSGAGERFVPVQEFPNMAAVLANPGQPLPTASVFAALRAAPAPPGRSLQAPRFAALEQVLDYMRPRGNDLERVATHLLPVVADAKAAIASAPGCLWAAMSGSGATCFGIFASTAEAGAAAGRIAHSHPDWWVRSTVLQGYRAA